MPQPSSPAIVKSAPINWDLLEPLLRCPVCHHEQLKLEATALLCQQCGVRHPIVDGIIDFLAATEAKAETPRLYRNRYYRTFIDHLALHHAAHYEEGSVSLWIENSIKADLFRIVDPDKSSFSVDLGCGLGDGFRFIGTPETIIGVDSSTELLRATRQRFPQTSLISTNLADLPFRTGVLGRVFAIAVLEHVFYLEATLGHIQRALAPDGAFYVTVPTEGSLAVAAARMVTSARSAKLMGMTPAETRIGQRIDHCNTVFLIEDCIRKFFRTEKTSMWPFRIGTRHINLAKSYKIAQLD